MRGFSTPLCLAAALSAAPLASAFSFAFSGVNSTLEQCQSVRVVWQGGQPPFELLIIPSYDYPQNISIPDVAWDSETESGSYTWQVNYPGGTNLVAMMSDATADGAGGVTSLFNVNGGDNSCSSRSAEADFTFQLNQTYINQCEPIDISWSAYAVPPIKILGVIPHGQAFMMSSANSNSLLRWVPNLAEGTVFIFAAFDAGRYGTGGSSNIYTISRGSDSCMDNSSPSSTAGNPVMTSGASRTPNNGTSTDGDGGVKTITAIATVYPSQTPSKGLATGSIVGIVVAIVLTVLALQAALLWFCCRRQIAALISHRRDMRKKGIKNGDVDLAATRVDPADDDIDLTPTFPMEQADRPSHAKSRSRLGLDAIETGADAPAISPFRDPSTVGRTGLPLLPSPNADPFWSGASPTSASGSGSHSGTAHALAASSDNLSLMPPEFPPRGQRSDSMDSGRTFAMSSRAGSQQNLIPPSGVFDAYDSPQSSPVAVSPSGSSGQLGTRPSKASLVAQIEREERQRQVEAQRQRIRQQGVSGISMASVPGPRLHATNVGPDEEGDGALIDGHTPTLAAPRGGFNRHQDAGPVPLPATAPQDEVEDLPPLYDAQWNAQQYGRR